MTHLFATSAVLAMLLAENGGEHVAAILDDPTNVVGISALTLFEIETAVLHRTGSFAVASRMLGAVRNAVAEIVPVAAEIVDLARELRPRNTAQADAVVMIVAATAVYHGAVLIHCDPHFAALPEGRPAQENLADRA